MFEKLKENKEKSFLAKNYEKFLENDYEISLDHYDSLDKVEYECIEKLKDACIEKLMLENKTRVVEFKYLGFSNGKETTYIPKNFYVSQLPDSLNRLTKEITSIEDIKEILIKPSVSWESFVLDFFKLSENYIKHLNNFKINFEDLDVTTCDDYILELFYKNCTKEKYGYKREEFECVGYRYKYFVCNTNLLEKNLKLVYVYLQQFYKYLFNNNLNLGSLMIMNDVERILPFVFETKENLAKLIAYNTHYCNNLTKMSIYNSNINMKECALMALDINNACYINFSEMLKKDKDICKKVLTTTDFTNVFTQMIKYGPFSLEEVKEMFLEKLN